MNNNSRRRGLSACLIAAACWLPLLAHADGSGASQVGATSASRAQELGILESVLHYCGSVDEQSALKLRDKIKQLVAGLNEQQVAALRQTADYRLGSTSIEQFTSKVDEHNSKRLCTESIAATK